MTTRLLHHSYGQVTRLTFSFLQHRTSGVLYGAFGQNVTAAAFGRQQLALCVAWVLAIPYGHLYRGCARASTSVLLGSQQRSAQLLGGESTPDTTFDFSAICTVAASMFLPAVFPLAWKGDTDLASRIRSRKGAVLVSCPPSSMSRPLWARIWYRLRLCASRRLCSANCCCHQSRGCSCEQATQLTRTAWVTVHLMVLVSLACTPLNAGVAE